LRAHRSSVHLDHGEPLRLHSISNSRPTLRFDPSEAQRDLRTSKLRRALIFASGVASCHASFKSGLLPIFSALSMRISGCRHSPLSVSARMEVAIGAEPPAIERVGKPHGRWRHVARLPVVTNIDPRPSGLRLSIAPCQHRYGWVVGMKLCCLYNVNYCGRRTEQFSPRSCCHHEAAHRLD
jgi:hypothetical protein